jgi:hypothetical protein
VGEAPLAIVRRYDRRDRFGICSPCPKSSRFAPPIAAVVLIVYFLASISIRRGRREPCARLAVERLSD